MEPLLVKPIWDWTDADVRTLVDTKLPEGMRVDYKRELSVVGKKNRIEVCKDVSGLANAQGGWIFYGVDEDESPEPLPVRVNPFDVEGDLTIFEDILDSSLQPRARFEARVLDVDGGQVVIVRVEPRQGALIMVQGYGEFRYYRRSGTRTIPMDQQEVSAARARDDDRDAEVMDLLGPRLPLATRIGRFRTRDGDAFDLKKKYGLRSLSDDLEWRPLPAVVAVAMDAPRPLIHHNVFARDDPFPELRDGFKGNRQVLPDPAWKLNAVGLARDQMFDPSAKPPRLLHRTAIFRDGIVEWARRYSNDAYVIPSMTFAEDVHDVLKYIRTVFASVDYFGRVAIFVRIENAEQERSGSVRAISGS